MPVETDRLKSPEKLQKKITNLLIATRGDLAVRAAIACRKRRVRAVIPYSDLPSEVNSLATRMADKYADDGWDIAHIGGIKAEDSYGDPKKILDIAELRNCNGIFLGCGFLAENPKFIRMVEKRNKERKKQGLTSILVLAPSSKAMEITGNKMHAQELAKQIKIPIMEGFSLRTSLDDLAKDADSVGYPVMIKDPNSGGGMGNQVANNKKELADAYVKLRIHGNEGLFLQRFITNAVHVEAQIAADQHGNVVCFGLRDCTLQRDYQKIVEESPSPNINKPMEQEIQQAAITLMKEAKYSGIGTVEFIVDMDTPESDRKWYFMEINPRIQIEHAVTEGQTGIDIVNLMMDIAEGKRLPYAQDNIKQEGYTIEARLYAEDPPDNFKQQEGELTEFNLPEDMVGIRVDKGYERGDEVSIEYDATLAKIIAHGNTREEAIQRLKDALDISEIAGVKTNRELLIQLIDTSEFKEGKVNTNFVKEWMASELRKTREGSDGISELTKNGIFIPYPPSRIVDDKNFPVNPTITSSNSDHPMTRSEIMQQYKERTGKECGSEYGIIQRDGIQFVVYALNPKFNRGSFGKGEGSMLEDACELAHLLNLPLITLTSTAGIRNTENTQGLDMMIDSVANIKLIFPPLFHIDIRHGYVLGGVPASYSGTADIFIATNTPATKIGLTGASAVGRDEGVSPVDQNNNPSTKAEDAYKALDERFGTGTTHTPIRHHEKRTGADVLVTNIEEAGDKIAHILTVLKKQHSQIQIKDSRQTFKPKEKIGYIPMPHPLASYDSPDNLVPSWTPPEKNNLWEKFKNIRGRKKDTIIFMKPLNVSDRRRIIKHPDRPTAIDCIDTNAGLFDDAVLLDNVFYVNGVHQTVPIISALVLYKDYPLYVVAQQPQQRKNSDGEIEVYYEPIRPADWKAMRRGLDLAEKLNIMVVEMGNTSGASASRDAEDQGQSMEIAETLQRVAGHRTPVISINYGMKGSGGGAPFAWYADYSVAWENAIASVANFPAMMNFLQGAEIIDESTATPEQIKELVDFTDQFIDSTAEGQLKQKAIDMILEEGPGGAHENPRIIIDSMKKMFDEQLPRLWKTYERGNLMKERRRRQIKVSRIGTKSNPEYKGKITKLNRRLG